MKTDIAYSTNEHLRITYRNFWYYVEQRQLVRGWRVIYRVRDLDSAVRLAGIGPR